MDNLSRFLAPSEEEAIRIGEAALAASRSSARPQDIRRGDTIAIGGKRRRVADVRPDAHGGITVDLEPLPS